MKFYNRTRKSSSIPKKLMMERKFHLIPLYYLLRTSRLAREGIENGGSYKFADHIYYGHPKGKLIIGYLIDWILLNLKSVKSFKYRYIAAKDEIHKFIVTSRNKKLNILAIPSGYARELLETAESLEKQKHPKSKYVIWHILDLDKSLLNEIKEKYYLYKLKYWNGNALSKKTFNKLPNMDLIISMGFTEFLNDKQVLKFYAMIFDKLNKGGLFVTSGMVSNSISDYLLRNIAELYTSYRSKVQLTDLIKRAGFVSIKTYQDKNKIQTIVIAKK